MRAFLFGGLMVLLSVWFNSSPVYADEPAECAPLRDAYKALTDNPISADDGTMFAAGDALADSGFMWKDKTYTERSTREEVAAHLQKKSQLDSLVWIGARYIELEAFLSRHCGFKPADHKDIRLMNPKPVTPTCKGPVPDLSKPLKR